MSREQIVRDTAYAIWEAEGKPQGRDAAHWQEAEARVHASMAKAGLKATAPVKSQSESDSAVAKPKAPAKVAATKAAPAPKKPSSRKA